MSFNAWADLRALQSQGSREAQPDQQDGVTGVTRVQASIQGPFSRTPLQQSGVTGVSPYQVLDEPQDGKAAGVWFCPEGGEAVRLCSPIHVVAVSHDATDNNFGRILRFRNTVGRSRNWAMPMEMLKGNADGLWGELLAMGVEVPFNHKRRQQLLVYLSSPPARTICCALQVGWKDRSFVLPDAVIGPDAENLIFQSGERGHEEYKIAGTLEDWCKGISALASGNPLLIVALSAAFTGPLSATVNAEGGGLHFVGDSSTGKTTLLQAASSVWGGPSYRRSWRATANGLEGAAVLFNDTLLVLDEISECEPREIGAIVYSVTNGVGKQRAGRTGAAKSVKRWRCFLLSSGEKTLATAMAEGGKLAKAGQLIRLLDISARRKFGAWDNLHGHETGTAFSDAIKHSTTLHHGLAGRAFLEKLTREDRNLCERLEKIKALPAFSGVAFEGQEKRAAGRFALLALAGELATEYDITGWKEGEALSAAAEIFAQWRASRGQGNDERRQVLEQVASFIQRHGDSRFSPLNSDMIVRDRAGYYEDCEGVRVYLFHSDGLREALKGFDHGPALEVLQAAGALPANQADGKRSRSRRIEGRPVRVYEIRADRLGGEHGS
jgi:putative DNA primase/helicase